MGIRDVAAEADVAVTTVFAHFATKPALVFADNELLEEQMHHLVIDRPAGVAAPVALRRYVHALVEHCASPGARETWRMIDGSAELREYEALVRLRHAETLARLLAEVEPAMGAVSCRALARFALDAYAIARTSADPAAVVDEIFEMVDAAWQVAVAHRPGSAPSR